MAAARPLIDHPLLDRLIRGRGWIVLITVTLLAVVAMQLSLLKLGAGIGRALAHTSLLQRENATLRLQVSSLSDPQRIQAAAARQGMILAPAGALRFLGGSPNLTSRALGGLRAGAGRVTAADVPAAAATGNGPGAGASAVTPLASNSASVGSNSGSVGSNATGAGSNSASVVSKSAAATTSTATPPATGAVTSTGASPGAGSAGASATGTGQ